MHISDINDAPEWIPTIARYHFEQWGRLTGTDSIKKYTTLLQQAVSSNGIPSVLVAQTDNRFLGSVNLVACDCSMYPELTPWLAQLFVEPQSRGLGIGATLVRAAIERSGILGFTQLHLYTSGTLPEYYARLGWSRLEEFSYLGKQRTLMKYAA